MSSSAPPSSSGNGNGDRGARRGGNEYEGPSRSRPRAINEVWPEPFVEALATQVAIDASRYVGRLAAAQALANVFQVCSTWRAVSRSDLLWHRLTRRIWNRTNRLQNSWREEYVYRHRTARNFRTGSSTHFTLHFDPADFEDPNDPDAIICRSLALSDHYLACGYADGAVRLFSLRTRLHTRTFSPQPRDNHVGRFSRAVSGIIIHNMRLIFATLNGDIHVATINSNNPPRRVHYGDVLTDGALIDFTGRGRWWVGLHAGVPGRAFHIWDGNAEELTFVGGLLTDQDSVSGWHALTDIIDTIGRVRVTSQETAIACTSSRIMAFDLRNQGVILGEDNSREFVASCFDVYNSAYISVDIEGVARVHNVDNLEEEERRFSVMVQRGMIGCMNGGYALMCSGGVVRIWEIEERGRLLYSFRERVGEVQAMVADERHVAAASSGEGAIHFWDFGAE